MRKKPKKGLRKRNLLRAGICFEALEPRLLLSGSWGAVVDGPGPDSPSDSHGGFTRASMVFHPETDINTNGSENRHLRPGSGRVDLLSRAPALNTIGNPIPALDASSSSIPAAPITDIATASSPADNQAVAANSGSDADSVDAALRRELVFVNDDVAAYDMLINGIRESDANRNVEVVVLDADRDGIQQVSDILADRSDLSAVHVIAHGTDGQIRLGNSLLNSTILEQDRDAVAGWGNALSETGDILFYGCDFASNDGQTLVKTLAFLTGADVAASTDDTGSALLGGDWDLEFRTGTIETSVALSTEAQNDWVGLLDVTLNSTSSANTTAAAASLTWSHTINSGGNRVLTVSMSFDGNKTSTGVTYGGTPLTLVGRHTSVKHTVEIWSLVAPDVGTANIVATFSSSTHANAGGVAFNDVDQTTPTGALQGTAGINNTPSITIGSAPGGMVIDTVITDNASTLTTGANQAQQWSRHNAGMDRVSASSIEAGAASVTMSWGGAADDWTIVAITIKPSVGNTIPVVTAIPGATTYTEQAAATVIDAGITLVDPDGFDGVDPSDQYTAVVRITGNYEASDILGFTNTANIQGALAGDTLTLSVIGGQTASVADFQAALRSVTFFNGSDMPGTLDRTVSFTFDDGVDSSNTATKILMVTAVNDDPTNAGTLPTDLVFLQDTQGKLDLSAIDLSDIDANGGDLTLTITSDAGHLQTLGGVGLTLSGSQSQLILTGSLTNLNNFLNDTTAIDYEHATPGTYGDNVDLITIEISDNGNTGSGGGVTNTLGTINIDIDPVAPQVDLDADDSAETGNNFTTTWTQGGGQIKIADTDAAITDADSVNLQSLTVTLTNHLDGADERMVADASGTAISVTYAVGPGEYYVYLSGADTVANYEKVLRTIIYDNTAASPDATNRIVTVQASDGTNASSLATATINMVTTNTAPTITSNGGGDTASVNVAENTIAVTTITATDGDGDTPIYSISGGTDSALFSIDAGTGVLTFNSAPNFEAPVDADSNNVYEVTVQARDGNGGVDTQAISVTVTDALELVVTNTNATGTGSLHDAILNANKNVGVTDTITFNIPGGGPHMISLTDALPAITDAVIINGTTDPDYAGDPIIRLDGNSAGAGVSGLTFTSTSDGSEVRGLMITGFTQHGIQVDSGADGITITNNWIGTTGTGSTGVGNGNTGINIQGANTIIGGMGASDGNVITNNGNEGINITGVGATGTIIQGNIIGLDPDGSSGSGNTDVGIALFSGANNTTIGGSIAAARNVISNNYEGIEINSNNNTVQGNYVGTDITGMLDRGNRSDDGVEIQNNTTGNLIGGEAVGAGNVIAFNAQHGVNVVNGTNNAIVRNLIHSNALLGINLGSGANNDQNFPVLTSAVTNGTQITVAGTLSSTASTSFRIEFYSNTTGDPTGYGEGQTLIGISDVTTDGSGNATFSPTFSETVSVGSTISAIVSRLDGGDAETDTSEFAQNVIATAAVNTAPELSGAGMYLTAIAEDATVNNGDLVSTIIARAGGDPITDADAGALEGIAIFSLSNSNGTWQYDIGSGSTDVGSVSVNSSLLLRDTDSLRFVPNPDWNGTELFTFAAWDRTSGTAGTKVDTSIFGGTTAFSVGTAIPSITVTAVNDDPTNAGTLQAASVVTEDVSSTINLSAINLSDVDAAAGALTMTLTTSAGGNLTAAAGTGITIGGNGTGVLSLTGNLTDLNTYLDTVGNVTYLHGVAHTNGSAADTIQVDITDNGNTGSGGGGTITLGTFNVDITAVNDAPTVTTTGTQLAYTEGDGATAIDPGLTLSDVDSANLTGATVRILFGFVSAEDSLGFVDQLGITGSYDSGTGILTLSGTASVADYQTALRSVTYENSSENPNTGDRTINITVTDGTSSSGANRTITVASINDDPTNTGSLPSDVTVTEDVTSSVDLSTVIFNDVDAGTNLITVTLTTSTGGRIWASSDFDVTVFGSGTGILTLQGGVADLNNFFSSASRFQYLHGTPHTFGDNADTIQVAVSDGGNTGTGGGTTIVLGTVNVDITNVNDAPVITSPAAVSAAENQTGVATVTATDADGDSPTFSITGGADSSLFSITAGGVLTFDSARDFETFADANTDGVYEVEVTADDGNTGTDVQTILVTVTDVNEAPTLVTLSSSSIDENTDTSGGTTVGSLTTTDPDSGDTATYSINGGADAAVFTISGSDLILTDGILDFETQSSYEVTVRITDSGSLTHDQTFTITVNDLNEAPVFDSTAVTGATQDVLYSYAITTSDVDGDALTITAPTLPAWLTFVDNTDGTATLTGTPTNLEVGDHAVVLQVTDGSLTATQSFTITVSNTNDAPVITSLAAVNAAENQTSVTTVTATDADGDSPTFSITGGADSSLFSITAGGVLTFDSARDFETFADANTDGVYEVEVTADDGNTGTDVQTILVTVTDVNEAPTLVTLSSSSIDENTDTSGGTTVGSLTTTDPDSGDTATYSINGGADAAVFTISGSDLILTDGILDFETQSSYEVTVRITDSGSLTHDQTFTITVNDLNEAPVFDSTAVTGATQDVLYSYAITTSDVDGDALTITAPTLPAWLTFVDNTDGTATLTGTPTNLEVGDHAVVLQVTDGSLTATQSFTITVSNTNDAPVITSLAAVNAAENQTSVTTVTATDADGDSPTFSITGGADSSLFSITAGGVLTFDSARDFETFADANTDGVYEVEVTADDGNTGTDVQTILVTVTDVNEAPTLVTLSSSSIDENTDTSGGTTVGSLTTTDPDSGDTATYSINGGADAAVFTISGSDLILTDGILDFETQSSYEVTVRITDSGSLTHDQTFTITVNDLNEAPVFDSTAVTGATQDVLYSYAITTSDVDGDALTITAPTLPAWLTFVDNTDGTATLTGTPTNLEVGDHAVVLQVTDGSLTATQSFTITVSNTNDAPVITSLAAVNAAENQTSVTTVTATDADGDSPTFSITGGADSSLFSITAGGVLTFDSARDFETFADANTDGVYEVEVTADDGNTGTDVQTILVTVTDVNEAPTLVTLSSSSIDENTDTSGGTTVGSLTTTDPDSGDTATYSINGGADAAVFTISGSDLILTDGILDFETQSSYEVTVRITDSGSLTHDQTFTITVNDLNEAPVFDSTAVTGATQDVLYSYAITTSDVDGDALTITAPTLPAWLTFVDNTDGTATLTGTPTNLEVGDHAVVLQVTDGSLTATQSFTITVSNTNDAPVITSLAAVNAAENQTSVTTVTATDADGDSPTFSITGGADSSLFSITAGGVLTFDSARDFETFADANTDGVYEVEVTADDGNTGTDVQTILVTVTDVNEAPTLVTLSSSSIDENTDTSGGTTVGSLTTTDPDSGDTATYSINGGADAAVFTISGSDLILTDGILDFETQSSYEVTVRITDSGSLTHDQTFTITVNDLNEAPVFDSTAVTGATQDVLYSYAITTSDVDGDALTITAPTLPAWLTFVDNTDGTATLTGTPTNLEVGDHAVVLQVTDGSLTATQSFTITVSNTNDAPVITSLAAVNAAENQTSVTTVTATDADGDSPTFSITGGADSSLFSITAGGVLTFDSARDFETFADANTDGVYEVEVTADDGNTGTDVQTILVTVTDVNEAPTLVTLSSSSIDENTDTSGGTTVGSLTTTDPDSGDTATYSINGGADAAVFTISGSDLILTDGILDFETQSSYEVTVRITDSGSLTHDQTFTITVNDLNEAPVFDSTAVTGATQDVLYSYAITTSDVDGDALTITAPTLPAWLTFVDNTDGTATLTGTPTNLEVGDHAVVLQVTDGSLTATQSFTITVSNTNDAPVITSLAAVNAAENQTSVTTVTATDADGDSPTFSITGGADSSLFSITAGGVLTFDSARDFETFADANTDGVYEVEVTADDGNTGTDVQTILVTVTDVNEAPTLVTLSSSSIDENTDTSGGTTVGSLTTTDPDSGDTATYSINGGADAAVFTISGSDLILTDGILDFETQSSYEVTVRITDSGSLTHDQTFTITVNDLNEAPVFDSTAVTGATQDVLYSYAITTSDVDGDALTITAPTLPAWLTFVDNTDGTATLTGTPTNLEVGDHAVVLQVTDGSLTATQSFTITVSNTNDAPVITSLAAVNAAENQTSVTTVTATDADGDSPTFSITGGADSSLFSITAGGVLTFDSARDFETFADANTDGVYEVEVTADDGNTGTDVQTILVTVTDVNEAPTLVTLSSSSIDENTDTSGGTTVGSLTTTDPDSGDTATYSINGGADAAVFTISGSDLILTDGILDFETQSSYEVTVRITDSGSLTHDQTFTITVNDLNEAPVFDSTAVTGATQDVLYSYAITTSDVDGDALTITAPTLPAWLTFVDNTDGTATLTGTPTNLEVGDHAVVLQVTDGSLTATQSFTITVLNANNAPVISGANTGAVTKNIDPDGDGLIEVGGAMTISDPDPAESSFQAGTVVGAYGSLTIDAAGNWNYAADNTQAVIQQLNTGESISDVLTVTTADGTTHSIVVTINGATAIVDQGGDDPGPGPGDDPIEPGPEPDPELPPEEILPVEDELPLHAELTVSTIPSSKPPVITPLQWSDPTYFVPTISLLKTDNGLPTETGSPSAMASIVKYLQRELASQTIERVASKVSALFSTEVMTQTLDHLQQQLGQTLEMDGKRGKLIIGAATSMGASVFAGYVIWALRGSSLLVGALTAMPMWRCFDPLPVLMGNDKKRRDRDEVKSTENDLDKDEIKVKEMLGEKQTARDV